MSRPAFTIQVTAEVLGISRQHVYNVLATGRLASHKRGGRRYVYVDDLTAFIVERRGRSWVGDALVPVISVRDRRQGAARRRAREASV